MGTQTQSTRKEDSAFLLFRKRRRASCLGFGDLETGRAVWRCL